MPRNESKKQDQSHLICEVYTMDQYPHSPNPLVAHPSSRSCAVAQAVPGRVIRKVIHTAKVRQQVKPSSP